MLKKLTGALLVTGAMVTAADAGTSGVLYSFSQKATISTTTAATWGGTAPTSVTDLAFGPDGKLYVTDAGAGPAAGQIFPFTAPFNTNAGTAVVATAFPAAAGTKFQPSSIAFLPIKEVGDTSTVTRMFVTDGLDGVYQKNLGFDAAALSGTFVTAAAAGPAFTSIAATTNAFYAINTAGTLPTIVTAPIPAAGAGLPVAAPTVLTPGAGIAPATFNPVILGTRGTVLYFANKFDGNVYSYDASGTAPVTTLLFNDVALKAVNAGSVDATTGAMVTVNTQSSVVNGQYVLRDVQGRIIASLGTPGAGDFQFSTPTKVTISADGKLLAVLDGGNNRIRVLDLTSTNLGSGLTSDTLTRLYRAVTGISGGNISVPFAQALAAATTNSPDLLNAMSADNWMAAVQGLALQPTRVSETVQNFKADSGVARAFAALGTLRSTLTSIGFRLQQFAGSVSTSMMGVNGFMSSSKNAYFSEISAPALSNLQAAAQKRFAARTAPSASAFGFSATEIQPMSVSSRGMTVWIQPTASSFRSPAAGAMSGMTSTAQGVSMGIDKVWHSCNGHVLFGVMAGSNKTHGKRKLNMGTENIQNFNGGLYGGYRANNGVYGTLAASFGHNSFRGRTHRLPGNTIFTSTHKHTGNEFGLKGWLGRSMCTHGFNVNPFVSLGYLMSKEKAYSETGPMALRFPSSTTRRFVAEIAATVDRTVKMGGEVLAHPFVGLGVWHERAISQKKVSNVAFVGGSGTFAVLNGGRKSKTFINPRLGINFDVKGPWSFGITGDGKFKGSSERYLQALLNASVKF